MTKKNQIAAFTAAINTKLKLSDQIQFVDMGRYSFFSYWGFEKKMVSNATPIKKTQEWLRSYVKCCENGRNWT